MSVTSTAFEIEPPEVASSSSIGKNSNDEEVGSQSSASNEDEAQSHYSGRLYVMEELELVLPMRRSISKFYDGKSKSFTSLAGVSASSSVQEIVKPENVYARRRRNLLAFNGVRDKGQSCSCSPRRGNATGGISKRNLGSSKSTLALAVAMAHSESYSYSDDSSSSNLSHSTVSFAPSSRPPPSTSPTKPMIPRPSRFPLAEELSLLDVYPMDDLHRHTTPFDHLVN